MFVINQVVLYEQEKYTITKEHLYIDGDEEFGFYNERYYDIKNNKTGMVIFEVKECFIDSIE